MFATFSDLLLSLLLALGLAPPGTPADPADSAPQLSPVAAADERAGNFDPNGLTSPPSDDESGGNFDPNGLTSSSTAADDEKGGDFDPDGAT